MFNSLSDKAPMSNSTSHETPLTPHARYQAVDRRIGEQSMIGSASPSLTLTPPPLCQPGVQEIGEQSIETPAFSPLTPKPLNQPGDCIISKRNIEVFASLLTPKPLYQPGNHEIGEQSVEAPAFSPLTPQVLNPPADRIISKRSIEISASPLVTPKSSYQTGNHEIGVPSVEAPAFTPLIPKMLYQPGDPHSVEQSVESVFPPVSPVPPMSPATAKLVQILEGCDFNDSDDSVKDPDYIINEDDDDKTYCSDDLDYQTDIINNQCNDGSETNQLPRVITVEAQIHRSHDYSQQTSDKNNSQKAQQQTDLDIIESIVEEIHENITTDNEHSYRNMTEGRPKRGRKRKGSCTREEIKQKKYNNLPYTNKKEIRIESKVFIDFKCTCMRNCSESVSKELREKEFNKYVHLGSYTAKLLYINSLVKEHAKKRTYTTNTSKMSKPRQFSRIYTLAGVQVCRDMFTKTLQITPQKVNVCLKKMRTDTLTDKRGIAQGGWNRSSPDDIALAVDVIKKLPKYTSHYRRENTEALYLQQGMTVRKIYEEYYLKEFNFLLQTENHKCLKYGTFKEIFYKKFNLKCKSLKKDTCNKCDTYAIEKQNGSNDENKHQEHLKRAEDLRTQMKKDFERAKTEENVECLTFDLEKTLPLPRIPTNVVFYKRQLWVYNSGIHSASDDKGHCYVWVEGEAGRGAQEVGSCLLHHIDNELRPHTEHLILWSDSCGGQNRNIKLTLMLKTALHSHSNLKSISLRFLEPGHTFLPNDTDFSKIESKLKEYERIYTVDDYMNIMRKCKTRNPLKVIRMKNVNFLSCKTIEENIINRKMYTSKKKVNWLRTKEILLKKEFPFSIFMRSDIKEESEFEELDIKKRAGKRIIRVNIQRNELVPLWPDGKAIAQPKLDDLKSIFELIPADCRPFYENLKGSNQIIDDVDGFGTVPDFDFEP